MVVVLQQCAGMRKERVRRLHLKIKQYHVAQHFSQPKHITINYSLQTPEETGYNYYQAL